MFTWKRGTSDKAMQAPYREDHFGQLNMLLVTQIDLLSRYFLTPFHSLLICWRWGSMVHHLCTALPDAASFDTWDACMAGWRQAGQNDPGLTSG